MKLTKTEQELIWDAEFNAHGRVCVQHGYQGKRRFGRRQHNAAISLKNKGLLKLIHSDGGSPLYKHGYGQNGRVYVSTWELVNL